MKKLLILLASALLIFSCAVGVTEQPGTEDTTDISKKSVIIVEIKGAASSRGGISVGESQIVQAVIEITAPDGTVESKTWLLNGANTITFQSKGAGQYNINVTETDSLGAANSFSAVFNVRKGFNSRLSVNLGENIIVDVEQVQPVVTKPLIFIDNADNILNIRQTEGTIDSYTIEWDAHPEATSYNVYNRLANKLITSTTATSFTEANITRRAFGVFDTDYTYHKCLKVLPVVNGVEVASEFYIEPIIFNANEVIKANFIDTFTDNSVDKVYEFSYRKDTFRFLDKIFNDNGQVTEANGYLTLATNTVDASPYLHLLVDKGNYNKITISSKLFMHRGSTNHNFYLVTPLSYMYMSHYESNASSGFYHRTFGEAAVQLSTVEKYDQWIDFNYSLDFVNNQATVTYGAETHTVNIDLSVIKSQYMVFMLHASAWGTGHYTQIDELKVSFE